MSSVLWHDRLDRGAEVAGLERAGDGWRLAGVALAPLEGAPAEVRYAVRADAGWATRRVEVECRLPAETRRLVLLADGEGGWSRDGVAEPALAGCIDVDLEISPITNTLPIRRLRLEVGATAAITAAWVRFPSLAVVRAEQRYRRLAPDRYRYRSGGFRADLAVDGDGLVLDYEGVWEAVART